mgnify:CR=1 FL=1
MNVFLIIALSIILIILIITDFSRYEDFGIISMSAFSVDKPRSPEEEKVNGSVLIIKDVEVYSAEESFYGWRFRDQ